MSYFDNEKKQKKLKQVLESWLETPFKHATGVKGQGVDCIYLVARVLEEVGLGPFRIPEYPKDWHLHNSEELLIKGTKGNLKVKEVKLDDIQNGDVIIYKIDKAAAHAAIYFDGFIYHAVNNCEVVRECINQGYFKDSNQVIKIKWRDCLEMRNRKFPVYTILRIL